MIKKSIVLVLTVAPLLFLFLNAYANGSDLSGINCVLQKSINKNTAVVGEELDITLTLTNNSIYTYQSYELIKEIIEQDFEVVGSNRFTGGKLGKNETHVIRYKIIPLSPGRKRIGPSHVKEIYVVGRGRSWDDNNAWFSNRPELDVRRLDLSVTFSFPKKEVTVQDELPFNVFVENTSPLCVEGIEILFDWNTDDVRPIEAKVNWECFKLPAGRSAKIPFIYRPEEVKKADLGRCIIKKAKIRGRWINLEEKDYSRTTPQINVKPIDLEVSQSVTKKKLRLGQRLTRNVTIRNKSDVQITDVQVAFEGRSRTLMVVGAMKKSKFFSIPPGQARVVSFTCKAMESGNVKLGNAVIKRIKTDSSWFHLENHAVSFNTVPQIVIEPVTIPGVEYPLTQVMSELEDFFSASFFILITSLIAFALLFVIWLFGFLINSSLVNFLAWRMAIVFFMVLMLCPLAIFFINGLLWVFRVPLQEYWMIVAVFIGCCIFALVFKMFLIRNVFLAILMSGLALETISYVLYTGLMGFVHQSFSTFPYIEGALSALGIGLALNLFCMRKELN